MVVESPSRWVTRPPCPNTPAMGAATSTQTSMYEDTATYMKTQCTATAVDSQTVQAQITMTGTCKVAGSINVGNNNTSVLVCQDSQSATALQAGSLSATSNASGGVWGLAFTNTQTSMTEILQTWVTAACGTAENATQNTNVDFLCSAAATLSGSLNIVNNLDSRTRCGFAQLAKTQQSQTAVIKSSAAAWDPLKDIGSIIAMVMIVIVIIIALPLLGLSSKAKNAAAAPFRSSQQQAQTTPMPQRRV